MYSLFTFYRSKKWQTLVRQIRDERADSQGKTICEYCGKSITKEYDCIGHHIQALTEENVNDYKISLNPTNIMLVHHKCHNIIHDKLSMRERKVYLVYGSPLAGKTSYVLDAKSDGDLIIDIDDIWQCVSGCERYIKPNRLRIISNHTKNTSENCYKDLNEYRNALIISLNSAGANLQTNSTVNDIAVAAKDLNTDIEKLAQIISEDTDGKIKECYKNLNEYRKDMIESLNKSGVDISENANIKAISEQVKARNIEITKGKEEIADAITSKGIETTSKDSLSNMAEKIKQIQTAGYGVSGYIDAIIETSGGIVAIYGLYTAEEQEAS